MVIGQVTQIASANKRPHTNKSHMSDIVKVKLGSKPGKPQAPKSDDHEFSDNSAADLVTTI